MSYARFGWDGSDVYVYESDRGWECCGCISHEQTFGSFTTTDLDAFFAHLDEHRRAGHHVPDNVEPDIRDDLANDPPPWLAAAGSPGGTDEGATT